MGCELGDVFISGTAAFRGHYPKRVHEKGRVVCRIFPVKFRQLDYISHDNDVWMDGYEFIGFPVDDIEVKKIREEYGMSEEYGAVRLPKSMLEGMNVRNTRLIVGEKGETCIVAGLLPTESLRWDAKRIMSDEERVVYALMEEFPRMNLDSLIEKWGENKVAV